MNWLIIALLIFLVFFFIRMKHTQHKVYIALIILVLLFVYVTGSRVLQENSVDLKNAGGMVTAVKVYFTWLGSVTGNFKDLAGHAVKLEWNFKNETGVS